MDLSKKQKCSYQFRKQTWLLRAKQRGINWEIGIDMFTYRLGEVGIDIHTTIYK